MKILKSKKGFDFAIALMVVVMICLGFLFVQLNRETSDITMDIGDAQIGLMLEQQEADQAMFYLDQAAKYSAYDSVLLLGLNGGHEIAPPACGEHRDYALWNKCSAPEKVHDCFPDFYANFKRLMEIKLNNYLDDYPPYLFLRDNFKFSYLDGKLTGVGVKNVRSRIEAYQPKQGETLYVGNYSFKPSFSVNFDYDFDRYLDLKQIAKELIDCVSQADTSDKKEQCISAISGGQVSARLADNRYVLIDAVQPEFTSPFLPITKRNARIKFAICVSAKEIAPAAENKPTTPAPAAPPTQPKLPTLHI